jgi:hypothetical protein
MAVQFDKLLLLLGIAVFLFCTSSKSVKANSQISNLEWLVRNADFVVVGKVIGLIDTKPVAHSRKHLEAHWILVEQTLKGIDETGRRLGARPNGLLCEDGRSYIIFFKRVGINWFEALPQKLTEASQTSVDAVVKEAASLGEGVTASPVLWMQHTGGWTPGTMAELFVTREGNFEWKERLDPLGSGEPKYKKLTGHFPEEVMVSLIQQVARAGPGPIIDDAGHLDFRWLDANDQTQFKNFLAPDQPPASKLLNTIVKLVRKYGRTALYRPQ